MPSWNDSGANLPDREAAIRSELTASGGGASLSSVLVVGNDGGGKKVANIADPGSPQDAATKNYVDSLGLSAVLGASNDAGATTITNLGSPSLSTDAATKGYVDSSPAHALSTVLAAGNDAGGTTITNLPTPAASSQAATKGYVDTQVSGVSTPSLSSVLGVGADAGAHTVTNAGAPTNQSDLATKNYVDSATFNNQSGTTYTLVLTDQGKTVNFTGASAATLTIPPNSSVAFPTSPATVIYVAQGGAGSVTVAAGVGVTLVNPYNSFVIAARYGEVKLTKIGTDTWRLNGEVL